MTSRVKRRLKEFKKVEDIRKLFFELNILLVNDGRAPAKDIDVNIHLPDGMRVIKPEEVEELPKPPSPPIPPRNQNQLLHEKMIEPFLRTGLGLHPPPNIDRILSKSILPNVSGPEIKKTDSYDVSYHIVSLKHGYESELDPFIIAFNDADSIKSFEIDYWISAANMPSHSEGKLHVAFQEYNKA